MATARHSSPVWFNLVISRIHGGITLVHQNIVSPPMLLLRLFPNEDEQLIITSNSHSIGNARTRKYRVFCGWPRLHAINRGVLRMSHP